MLGSGQRCGSTLAQRLLSSHRDVFVWGEHGGHLREVLSAANLLAAWDKGLGEASREQFAALGHDGWVPNLLPGPEVVHDAARSFMEVLFAAPAAAHGCSRWGFKEVRFGLKEAEAVRALYPDTRVLHITRDPRPVLSSLEHWERTDPWWRREFTRLAVDDWLMVNASFLDGEAHSWVRSWRLEDATADPDGFVTDCANLLGVDPSELDRSVMDRRVYGEKSEKRDLKPFENLPRGVRRLLRGSELRRVARAYGYEL